MPSDSTDSPIVALFLTKFDVHSGYDLKWFRSLDNNIYPSKSLEFKTLPSGLHAVEADTICFTQEKTDINLIDSKSPFLYGLSVFRQNKAAQKADSDSSVDREQVKLYSLGILIDPDMLPHSSTSGLDTTWKPKVYSACWNYKTKLSKLIDQFMKCNSNVEEAQFYSNFELFYDEFKSKISNYSTLNERTTRPTQRLLTEQLNATLTSSTANGPQVPRKATPEIESSGSESPKFVDGETSPEYDNNDHMIDSILPLYQKLGPLIYKIWKLSLLRKKIIIHTPHNPASLPSFDESDHEEGDDNDLDNPSHYRRHNNEKPLSIGDMAKFIYSISLISSIPKEIQLELIKSGVGNIDELEFNRPIYNLCVNDLTFMKNLKCGFIGSTTDQIILEKSNLYDYSLKLPINNSIQCTMNDLDNTPQIFKAGDLHKNAQLASQRDFGRFKLVYSKLFEQSNDEYSEFPTPDATIATTSTSSTRRSSRIVQGGALATRSSISTGTTLSYPRKTKPQHYQVTVEPVTLKEFVWKGLAWWATAGESSSQYIKEDEFQIELDNFENDGILLNTKTGEDNQNVEVIISLVGYFQKLTIRLFVILIELMNNEFADVKTEQQLQGQVNQLERDESFDGNTDLIDNETGHLLANDGDNNNNNNNNNNEESGKTIWIELQDVYEMGLDPYSDSDREFLIELVKVWWGKDVRIGRFCGDFCCF